MTNEPEILTSPGSAPAVRLTNALGPHLPLGVMLAAYHSVCRIHTVDDLIDSALRPAEYEWSSWAAPVAYYIPRRGGWVVITEQEFTELGIPERSRRGLFDTSFTDLVLVDRRCLKRYRRKARGR